MAHKPLTDSKIRDAKARAEPYKLTDGKGLYLEVRPTGAKLWRYRYRIGGKENVFALGEYVRPAQIDETPEQKRARFESHRFTLEEARQQRHDARGLVKRNRHPKDERDSLIAQRVEDNANTFEVVAREWLAHKAAGWTSSTHDQTKRTLELHVFADLGKRPVNQPPKESARIILGIINRVKKRAPNTAANIRKWCSAIFCYGVTTLRADADPTLVLKDAIELPDTKHKTPLTKEQIPVLLHRIDNSELFPMTRIALKLLLYMFKRPVEVRFGEWNEFDLEAAEWRIPAGKMKKRREHVEPLSTQSVELLRELKAMTGGQNYILPNYRHVGAPIAETTLIRALAAIGYEGIFTPHGFRATASTLLHELGFDEKLIDLSMAHKKRDKTTVSYDQYKYIAERRKLMQSWADYVDALCAGANVTPIGRAKAA